MAVSRCLRWDHCQRSRESGCLVAIPVKKCRAPVVQESPPRPRERPGRAAVWHPARTPRNRSPGRNSSLNLSARPSQQGRPFSKSLIVHRLRGLQSAPSRGIAVLCPSHRSHGRNLSAFRQRPPAPQVRSDASPGRTNASFTSIGAALGSWSRRPLGRVQRYPIRRPPAGPNQPRPVSVSVASRWETGSTARPGKPGPPDRVEVRDPGLASGRTCGAIGVLTVCHDGQHRNCSEHPRRVEVGSSCRWKFAPPDKKSTVSGAGDPPRTLSASDPPASGRVGSRINPLLTGTSMPPLTDT